MPFPAAVLFDLDGTLVDTERVNVESVVLAARRWAVELDSDERLFIVGHSWNEIHAMIQRKHGIPAGMDELIAAAVAKKRLLLQHEGFTPLPGAVELVRRLAQGAKLAVVSGASKIEVEEAVAGIGLRECFQVLLGAEDYARGKPHPEPYQTAMRMLGVSPGGVIVIEDAEPGILAARAAGAKVIAVRVANFSNYDQSAAHVIVDTLTEVTDELCARLLA
jgi:HAD superfamily hydrolase (TIGR01509 family)